MTDAHTELLPRNEQARAEIALGTADLVRQANAQLTDRDGTAGQGPERTPLFPEAERGGFRQQWQETQAHFVDDPRTAVRQADELVASLMKRLAEAFAAERERLERDWDQGEEVSTEELRQALRRYRSFFDRLLSV